MKNIIQFIFILSLFAFISGCEKDSNGRMPDDIKDSNAGVLIVTTSDPFINVSALGDYEINLDLDLLFEGELQKLDLVIAYNGDFTKQYVINSVTSVPQSVTVTTQDIIDAIGELSNISDIVAGDYFDLFTSITLTDGTYIPGYDEFGTSTNAPSVTNIMGVLKEGSSSIKIPVPCFFNPADYVGEFNANENWGGDIYNYPVAVIEDPDYTGSEIGLKVMGLWDGTYELGIELSSYDYSIIGNPASQRMADVIWSYTDPTWSSIYGSINTCEKSIEINIGSFCVNVGCFGGMPIVYTLTTPTPSKKALLKTEIPYKPMRILE